MAPLDRTREKKPRHRIWRVREKRRMKYAGAWLAGGDLRRHRGGNH